MTYTPVRSAFAAAAALALLAVAACGNDDGGHAPPSGSSTAGVPAPIGELATFLSEIDAAGGCSQNLITGVADGIGALNTYGVNTQGARVDGTAEVASHAESSFEGVPACTFTIDPGNTDLPETLIIGGLTADRNIVLSPTTQPSMIEDDGVSESAGSGCTDLGVDRVAAAAAEVTATYGSGTADCENRSHNEIYDLSSRTFSIIGAGGYTTSSDGYFVAAADPDAARTGATSDLASVFGSWIQRGPREGSSTDFTRVIG